MDKFKEIESYAEGLLSPVEICKILEEDIETTLPLFSEVTSEYFKAYEKGTLQRKYRINMRNIKFAEQGSSHAMNLIIKQQEDLDVQINKEKYG